MPGILPKDSGYKQKSSGYIALLQDGKFSYSLSLFDFVEENFPGYRYKAVCTADNEIAIKVFTKRGYDVFLK